MDATIKKFMDQQIQRKGKARLYIADGRKLTIRQGVGFTRYIFDGVSVTAAEADRIISNRFNPENLK